MGETFIQENQLNLSKDNEFLSYDPFPPAPSPSPAASRPRNPYCPLTLGLSLFPGQKSPPGTPHPGLCCPLIWSRESFSLVTWQTLA